MGLRIATNVASQQVQKNLRKVSGEVGDQLSKLSSGKRINKSADDAAGLSIAKNLDATVRGLRQATRNASDGVALIQVAEGGLNEITNIVTRLRELSIQAASDTVGETERGFLDKEYQNLIEEVERISQSTKFNGANLINGESELGVMQFHVGAGAGEQNQISFDAGQTNATADNLDLDGLEVTDQSEANDAIEVLDEALTKINGYRANLGAIQSRLNSSISNLEIQSVNQDAARSTIEDVDVAKSASKLASGNVIKQAGVASLAQANNIPNSALQLIG